MCVILIIKRREGDSAAHIIGLHENRALIHFEKSYEN